jgi:tripartite-type tricarboxylate transporter receptor subunit TctC
MANLLRMLLGLFPFVMVMASGVGAQERYPSHTVRIVVPTSAGGVTDVLGRIIAQGLTQTWGQPVIVDNRPGADNMIGVTAVAKSAADGYTLLVTSDAAITGNPHLHKDMRYDPLKDFTPLLMLGQITPVLNVPASLPVQSFKELVALAKSKPGALNYGSFGNGTYTHLSMEDLKRRTGMDMMHIPYKGSTPAITALLRGEISALIVNMGNVADHARAGSIRILAAAGAKRPALRPDLPTIAEEGVPGFSTGAWWGLFAPANLPREIVDKIRADVSRILATPETRKVYMVQTIEAVELTQAQFAQLIRDDYDKWGALIKAVGIELR